MKEGIPRIDLSDLNARHYKSQRPIKTVTAYESLIQYEGSSLANVAKMVSGNNAQARETLQQIYAEALKHLEATQEFYYSEGNPK